MTFIPLTEVDLLRKKNESYEVSI